MAITSYDSVKWEKNKPTENQNFLIDAFKQSHVCPNDFQQDRKS